MTCAHCTKGKVKVDRRIMGVAIEVEIDCDVCKGTGLNQDPAPECSDGSVDFSNVDWSKVYVEGGDCCWPREEQFKQAWAEDMVTRKWIFNGGPCPWDREDNWSDEAVKREIAQLKEYYAHPTISGWDWAAGYYDWRKGAKAES